MNSIQPGRRRFVQGLAALGSAGLGLAGSGAGSAGAAFAAPADKGLGGFAVLNGPDIALTLEEMAVNFTGRARIATVVNRALPGPLLRLREGQDVTIRVTNRLRESSSIHWHGLKLPNAMDGVPGLTFAGIAPGETFTYRFPLIQAGTYWYHSHSGMQEQTGLSGAMIIDPRGTDPVRFDREYVVQLADWTDEDPMTIVSNLKQQSDYYNYHQRTLATFIGDVKQNGFAATLDDRLMWGDMRMSPADIMDVTGAVYTFLMNGHTPAANWNGLFHPGERVRLRFINGSAMTTFDVRIPGLNLTVVQADGSDVEPVEVEEFRIGVAETYDVIVTPGDQAYTIFAQAQDRSGYARGTLAPRPGMTAVVPAMDAPPLRTMADMGMDHGAMDMAGMNHGNMDMGGMDHGATDMAGMDMKGMDMSGMDHAAMGHGAMNHAGMDHAAMGHTAPAKDASVTVNASGVDPATLRGRPFVDGVPMMTMDRLDQAGTGLDGNGRKTLRYGQLRALAAAPVPVPSRDIVFHLTGNMERWVWGFDGKKFSEAPPVRVKLNETVRFVLINDTMMEHPIHLHGFLFTVENGQGEHCPLKHTINVKPAERLGFVFTADVPGHWAFHCHLMYHMEMGMFRTVIVA